MKNRSFLFTLLAVLILVILTPAVRTQEAEFFGKCTSAQVARLHKAGFSDTEIQELCDCIGSPEDQATIDQLRQEINSLKSELSTLRKDLDSANDNLALLLDERDERIKAAEQQRRYEWWQSVQEGKKREKELEEKKKQEEWIDRHRKD